MSHAETILRALDRYLESPAELTLYGRAALQLGYADPRPEYAQSLDVDGIFWIGQAEALLQSGNFWDAVERVNRDLAPQGLYVSHFFEENQVVLTPDWRRQRVPIPGTWTWLQLWRLSDRDLFLTKLMRNDPLDAADADFILSRSGMTRADVQKVIASARVPAIPEIQEQFALCSKRFL